ncbi:CRISP/Allergen/PR-1 [Armadillidium nasatum]|uniref:CRISP/Allergen/PR-1 n=1 Tax=Armadillidium nasatum TaxID=96803 RepID=A0A5N5SNC1_9CRUS|nr:CRISP/Allergen/PR-1 [Armadillidium nasatum]
MLVVIDDANCNKYCDKYGKSHTMCKPKKGKACGSAYEQFKFSKKQINQLLSFHNKFRQRAANGKEIKTQGTLPKAADMCQMKWDNELAAVAQKLANQCEFKHDCNECRYILNRKRINYVGQNIAYSASNPKASDKMAKFLEGANLWYSKEVGDFKDDYVAKYKFGTKYGHYSQLIWANSCYLGCGGSIYKKGDFYHYEIVCNYGEAGNFENNPVYKKGKPCSACPKGRSCSKSYPGLCGNVKNLSFWEGM